MDLGDISLSKIPSLKVESVEISPIFPAKLNVYSRNPNGIAYLSNPTNKELSNVKLSAYIRKFMDFPSETESFNLKAGASEVPVQFLTQINASTLSLSEDTSVQMQISLSWDENGNRNTLVYNLQKNGDDLGRFCDAFVFHFCK